MAINKQILIVFGILFLIIPMVSAGIGISWDRENSLIHENEKTCLTYKIYNPFDGDVYVEISLSEELEEIITYQESETKLIPSQTSSANAIPVTFCFKTPKVYEKDCLIGDSLICKQECTEDMKIFSGEVEISEVGGPEIESGGSGGSKTAMSVSAPLRIKVRCVPHSRDYSLVYLTVAIIAAILLAINLFRLKKKKSGDKGKKANKKKS
jgi:hypothetical protein